MFARPAGGVGVPSGRGMGPGAGGERALSIGRARRSSFLSLSRLLPSTTQSAPATPTASEPLRTASRAYSTWKLEREEREEERA